MMCERMLFNSNGHNKPTWVWPILLLLAIVACRKQDIEPDPVGEPVPYTGPVKALEAVLEQSPHSLFLSAWKKAVIADKLGKLGNKNYTLFVPSNAAMQEGGWNTAKINAATPGALDTLLSYYIVEGDVAPASLATIKGNMALASLRKTADIPQYSESSPYTYMLLTGVYNDSLRINGHPVAKWGNGIATTSGTIYTIEHLLPLPTMDLRTFLESDERFSFYMEACRINDSLYQEKSPWWNQQETLPVLTAKPQFGQFTLFAPTNEAFKKSGLKTIDDIRALACRTLPIGEAYNDENGYYVDPNTALDSILLAHRQYYAGEGGPASEGNKPIYPAFYYNDLMTNPGLNGYLLQLGRIGSYKDKIMDLEFTNKNGQVFVKRQGSKAPALRIHQYDIQLLNGVVQVINDGLFVQ